jgi:photosystem II stability/assembly factor-like uncharacterized protein
MKNLKHPFFLLFCLTFGFASLPSFSQVFTEVLRLNPAQHDLHKFNDQALAKRSYLQKNTYSDTIAIPFFDDFSGKDLSWAPSRVFFGQPIRFIRFTNNTEARAFGGIGLNLRTGNRGSTWENIGTDPSIDFTSASFPEPSSPEKIWTCGNQKWLANSSNGGTTWNPVPLPSDTGGSISGLAFFSFGKGLVIDSLGRVFLTTDTGNTWTLSTITNGVPFKAASVAWVNANRVVAVGDSAKTAVSDNGGLSFSVTRNPIGRNKNFQKVKMASDGFLGLALGDSGLIYRTVNSGTSWYSVNNSGTYTLYDADINPANKKLAWAVGSGGTLLYSQNGGNGWLRLKSGISEDLLSIALVNEFRGWIGTSNGRLLQVVVDPLRPFSRWWEPNSGVFINNTFPKNPITTGVATFDGLNNQGLPYSLVKNKNGPCDTLISTRFDLSDFAGNPGTPLFLSFFYQPGSGHIELIPDPEDSLVLQFEGKSGYWQSLWNVKGITDTVTVSPFRYVSVPLPDSLKFSGSRFRFLNFGNQNGNFDIWHVDYVRLDGEHDQNDSLARDYALVKPFGRLMKDYSALPMEQFRHVLSNPSRYFPDSLKGEAVNLNPSFTNLDGLFYLNRQIPDTTENLAILPNEKIRGLQNTFGSGVFSRELRVAFSDILPSVRTDRYTTFEYGVALKADPLTNLYQTNDTLLSRFNASTTMAYDDGSGELVRGVGDNGSIGAVKYYLPVADTLTDIQLYFARTPENLQQTISFYLLVLDSVNVATNYPSANDLPIIRKQFILPPSDSVNKFITFSLRDDATLAKRILPGGRSFYVGWQQGLIDNGNEVRLGCDINSSNPGTLFFKSGQSWRMWEFDNYPLMIRPVFGPEYVTSVRTSLSKPLSPFYPNPARTSIFNRLDFRNLQIFNSLGQEVAQRENGLAEEPLNLNLPKGIYSLKWQEQGGAWVSQRLIVE